VKTQSDQQEGNVAQNAIDVLMQEHREAEQLLTQLQGTQGSDMAMLEKTAQELRIHMKIEEEILYPFIRQNIPNGQELMAEAEQEHTEAREALEKTEQAAGTPQFEQALTKLTEGVQHHVQEEETEVFPKLQENVDQAKLEKFGQELTETKQRLIAEGRTGKAEGKTRDELYAQAKEVGIEGRSKMDKEELAQAVETEA
jgi:iron-sulfur cluster repair protein YtfE (RIC family)